MTAHDRVHSGSRTPNTMIKSSFDLPFEMDVGVKEKTSLAGRFQASVEEPLKHSIENACSHDNLKYILDRAMLSSSSH